MKWSEKAVKDAKFLVEQSAQMAEDSARMARDSDRQASTCYAEGIVTSQKAISDSRHTRTPITSPSNRLAPLCGEWHGDGGPDVHLIGDGKRFREGAHGAGWAYGKRRIACLSFV